MLLRGYVALVEFSIAGWPSLGLPSCSAGFIEDVAMLAELMLPYWANVAMLGLMWLSSRCSAMLVELISAT